MRDPLFNQAGQSRLLDQIEEGMKVYDRDGEQVGEVTWLHYGAAADARYGEPARPAADAPGYTNPVDDMVRDIFDPDDLPEEVRERLLQDGFIRVGGTGLFAGDLYILPDQVAAVTEDEVKLRVSRDELLED